MSDDSTRLGTAVELLADAEKALGDDPTDRFFVHGSYLYGLVRKRYPETVEQLEAILSPDAACRVMLRKAEPRLISDLDRLGRDCNVTGYFLSMLVFCHSVQQNSDPSSSRKAAWMWISKPTQSAYEELFRQAADCLRLLDEVRTSASGFHPLAGVDAAAFIARALESRAREVRAGVASDIRAGRGRPVDNLSPSARRDLAALVDIRMAGIKPSAYSEWRQFAKAGASHQRTGRSIAQERISKALSEVEKSFRDNAKAFSHEVPRLFLWE